MIDKTREALEREQFEKWAATQPRHEGVSMRYLTLNNAYVDYELHGAWLAWQARAALAAPVVEAGAPTTVDLNLWKHHILPQGTEQPSSLHWDEPERRDVLPQPVAPGDAEVDEALFDVDDHIARMHGDDRGSFAPVEVLRSGIHALRAARAAPVYCGHGCACVTQCGDAYDHAGEPKPPAKEYHHNATTGVAGMTDAECWEQGKPDSIDRAMAAERRDVSVLDRPARVGNATFGVGVATLLVVEAAQRQHEYQTEDKARTPEQWREIERNRRALWDMLNGTLEPDHQELPPLPPRYAGPETGHAAIRRDEDLLEWGREIQRQAFEAGKRSAPAVSGEAVAWLVRAKNGMVRACWTYAPDQDQLDAAAFDGDTITPLYAHPTGEVEKDAARWRFFRVAGSTVTLRMHNTRPDHRDAAIDAAISGETSC